MRASIFPTKNILCWWYYGYYFVSNLNMKSDPTWQPTRHKKAFFSFIFFNILRETVYQVCGGIEELLKNGTIKWNIYKEEEKQRRRKFQKNLCYFFMLLSFRLVKQEIFNTPPRVSYYDNGLLLLLLLLMLADTLSCFVVHFYFLRKCSSTYFLKTFFFYCFVSADDTKVGPKSSIIRVWVEQGKMNEPSVQLLKIWYFFYKKVYCSLYGIRGNKIFVY